MFQGESAVTELGTAEDAAYPLAKFGGERPAAPGWFTDALAVVPERSSFVSTSAEIELLTWGEVGKPGLLFLHGQAGCADWWRFIAPFFARDYRCAAISWSGMGGSDRRPDGLYDYVFHEDEAHDAIAAAQLDVGSRKPIVIGQSMAGFVAVMAAVRFDCFSGLIAIDSVFSTKKAADPQRLFQGHRNNLFPNFNDALARYRLFPPQPCENLFIMDFLARHSMREDADGWRWRVDPAMSIDLPIVFSPDILKSVPCPMVYLHGEKSTLVAPRVKDIIAGLPPGAKAIEIPDSNHNVNVDQPLALIAALGAVLAGWRAHSRDENLERAREDF